ncbi:MAG: S41 family peptidase [Henriciella sp.]|nr:S41 family peptidase [Henriciella sp.]
MTHTSRRLPGGKALAIVALATLAACGGGGGGSSPTPTTLTTSPPPPEPTPTEPAVSFVEGVFEPASTFKDQCEAPRSGVDIEGNAFPDEAGSLLEELFWLRSWTNETYLWNDQVEDRDPSTFDDRLDYFAVLKTDATTASGEDLDDFHFSEPTDEFLERRNSAASSGYGASIVAFSTSVPRDYRIRYTEPDSPASDVVNGLVNFPRGARILEVDGVDLVNGGSTQAEIDILNAGLFPATAGETHTFVIQDAGSTSSRTVTLISEDIAQQPVNRFSTIDTSTGKVGYILFNTFSPFSSEADIANAITAMKTEGVSDLVLDLRYNGGGLLAVAAQLGYMIAGDAQTAGKTFELLQFNDDAGNVNPVTGERNDPIPFIDTGIGFSLADGTPLDSLDLSRVFILSTAGTCSASEAVINGLRGIDVEIILIGDITCGKPYGFYPTDNCGETYYTIQFRGVNEKNFGDYSDGFVPMNSTFNFGERVSGCIVPDDYNNELGDPAEGLLAAALQYREDGSCPVASATQQTAPQTVYIGSSRFQVGTTFLTQEEDILANNRDMRMPK